VEIHCNLILPYVPRSSKWSISLSSPHQNTVILSPLHATCPAHFILDLISCEIFGKVYRSQGSLLCSLLHFRLLCPYAQISSEAPYSWRPSAYIPTTVWETRFHTHAKWQAKLWFFIS